VRRFTVTLYVLVMSLALPAAAWAASPSTSSGSDAPTGHDYTLTSIFIVAAGIPTLLAVLTLIDVARGKHSRHDPNH
jgi:hypothetical protein